MFRPPPESQGGRASPAIEPPMAMSNEADKEQLDLAREQGRAEGEALRWITEHATGPYGEVRAGALRVVYTVTPPEGSYRFNGNELEWAEPASDASAHLRVFLMDAGDGRLVPELHVRATVLNEAGREVASTELPFAWYPVLNGYGANIPVRSAGAYQVRVEVEPPTFRRHDPYNGYRFYKPIIAVTGRIRMDPQAMRGGTPTTVAEERNQSVADPEAKAFRDTLANMYRTAIGGKDQRAGDYVVANANEYSEAYWSFENGHFALATEMENAATRNAHIEVAVMDAKTGRFVPGLQVTARLTAPDGRVLGTHQEPFMWHPWLWHYGENWRIPHGGRYSVHVHFDPPPYARYGRESGGVMKVPVDMDFDGQQLHPGQK